MSADNQIVTEQETTPDWTESELKLTENVQYRYCKVIASTGIVFYGRIQLLGGKSETLEIPIINESPANFFVDDRGIEPEYNRRAYAIAKRNTLIHISDMEKFFNSLGTKSGHGVGSDFNLDNSCHSAGNNWGYFSGTGLSEPFEKFVEQVQRGNNWKIEPLTLSGIEALKR